VFTLKSTSTRRARGHSPDSRAVSVPHPLLELRRVERNHSRPVRGKLRDRHRVNGRNITPPYCPPVERGVVHRGLCRRRGYAAKSVVGLAEVPSGALKLLCWASFRAYSLGHDPESSKLSRAVSFLPIRLAEETTTCQPPFSYHPVNRQHRSPPSTLPSTLPRTRGRDAFPP